MIEFIRSSYFQGVISGFSSGVVIINTTGNIYVFNRAAAAIFRRDHSECLYVNYRKVVSVIEKSGELDAMIGQVAASWTPSRELTTTLAFPDGTLIYLTISATPLVYHHKLFGILLEIQDVSHIFHLHAQEKKTLNEKREVERRRTESLKLFSEAVAHQIRNPVMIIGGLTHRLIKSSLPPTNSKTYFNKILECSQRLEQIVEAVNQFASLGSEELEKIELFSMLQSIIKQLQEELPQITEKISWYGFEQAGTIYGFPKQLKLALYEVCRNSIEAIGGKPGSISIERTEEGDNVLLHVGDTGGGISDSIRPFLFDPFFTTREKAVGMGLCKVQHVMNEHKGAVHVASGVTCGTTVILVFTKNWPQ
jgi:signal transduction histidine kinase